ncbi:Arylsulfatase precursor [Posidoniimonas polymericola]|uniref:Arylsulfatase n=1 Tax=Posidoniimonas polymericola TaxID=2528002 RepID=A0A5C5ZDH2_9BACT|nr:arylsulfatase [Posidoniimonas polymericola]TWT85196.1 Arylsulfatase precursor [Posidoniimonas polymericola]
MTRCALLFLLVVCRALPALAAEDATTRETPPNIVFILADDLGYGELGCYGQEKIRTPNIDRLAGQGVRFLQHYSGSPVCAPARCSLLTGQHGGHAEIRANRDSGNGRIFPAQWPISSEVTTIAQVLKRRGYATGAFGKWGLGPMRSTGAPNDKGFDRFYGYLCQRNAHSYFPRFLDSDDHEVEVNRFAIPGHFRQPTGEVAAADYRGENYAPDLILEQALKFLDDHKSGPFFLYLPFVEPHLAMQPPEEWVERYPKEWDAERGPYRGENGYLPHPRPRAAYAAIISDLDQHVGQVLAALDQHGLAENTVVVFTSDNGSTFGVGGVGGVDVAFFDSTGGLKGAKASVYEGGLRVPCIVRWPGVTKPGQTTDAASYFPDWFPTLAGIADATAQPTQPLDGQDLRPVLRGEALTRPGPMVWEFGGYGGMVAVRDGDWKALRRDLKRKNKLDWELYNLADDPNESRDLAADHPERVRGLERAYLANRTIEPDFPLPIYDRQTGSALTSR